MRSQIVTLPTRDMAQYALSKEVLLATGNADSIQVRWTAVPRGILMQ